MRNHAPIGDVADVYHGGRIKNHRPCCYPDIWANNHRKIEAEKMKQKIKKLMDYIPLILVLLTIGFLAGWFIKMSAEHTAQWQMDKFYEFLGTGKALNKCQAALIKSEKFNTRQCEILFKRWGC
jgi:hypothetical protein